MERVVVALAWLIVVSVAHAQQQQRFFNNVDVVKSCLHRHKEDPKSLAVCVDKNKVSPPGLVSSEGRRLGLVPRALTDESSLAERVDIHITPWSVTEKHVDHDEDWRNSFTFNPPGNDFMLCGYKISELSNIHSSWSVHSISEDGATVDRRVKGQGFGFGGGSLILGYQTRWLSKFAAGRATQDYRCDTEGVDETPPWRMTPTGNSKIRAHQGCLGFVMICYDKDALTGARTNEAICGVCVGFSTSF